MSQLPLALRVKIRDLWDAENTRMREQLKAAEQILGPRIALECRWPLLYAELKRSFPDVETLVPSVVDLVEKWTQAFMSRLEATPPPPWVEYLVESSQQAGRVRVVVEAVESETAGMRWDKAACTFVLQMPGASPRASNYAASFESAFYDLNSSPNDDFIDVQQDDIAYRPPRAFISETLPTVDTLDRPEELFTSLPIKYITISQTRNGFRVSSTHEKSLVLMQEYFVRWMRPLQYSSSERFKIQLKESDYGKGHYFDKLDFEKSVDFSSWESSLDITLLVAFIEGVLGYTVVSELSSSSQVYFRRTIPLT